ncbi:hypothetical protein LTR35_014020 [Friedmanniomyces endolithicus]|uniref:Uncharacterized protein n=1 Tax=Friedmanniomyces endolithicus TaxID=329885 RepID=A0AAN6J0I6_9PEZI|nr:hypothetical protein LTR35_014020 [Friedmanniomyces endolithicus]KAK0281105.1 hypothetical protein LTS00_012746 [Friedmanniomyces endolithicus]KAK0306585.1 hypothetical protein LTR82_016330 [Friedmanniomyces endolithicus]KAK0987204.1 hypothetical protein LTR54_013157 [Friedmanniomyces endolithicus]
MAVPPGYSVNDLILAIGKVKDVFDVFFDEYQNAPRQLRELRDELQRLQDELGGLKLIEVETGKSYTGRDALQTTLNECEAFVKSHKSALTRSRGGLRRGDTALGVLQTGLFAFEQQSYERLLDHLSRRRIELVGFYVLLLLHRSLSSAQPQSSISTRRPSVSSISTAPSRSSTQTRSSFDPAAVSNCIVELRSIGNTLTRVGGGASMDLDARLQRTITVLSDLTGLPSGLIPHVPVADFARRSHQSMWQTIMETGAGAPSRYPTARGSETISRACNVYIQRGQHVTQAAHCTMMSDTLHRYCYFFDEAGNQVMVHHLPRDCHPYTYHSRFRKPLVVLFKSSARVVPPLPADQEEDGQPVYHFQTPEDLEVFQSDARNRKLIGQFDVDSITCPVANNCHAQNVQAKLWRSRRDPTSTTLTFRAKQQVLKDLDFRLRYLRISATDPSGRNKRRQSSQALVNSMATTNTQRSFDAMEYIRLMQHIRFDFATPELCAEFVTAFREAQMGLSRPASIRTVSSTATVNTPCDWTFTSSPTSDLLRPRHSRAGTLSTPGTSPMLPEVAPSGTVPPSRLPPPRIGSTATGLVGLRDVVSGDEAVDPMSAEPETLAQTVEDAADDRRETGTIRSSQRPSGATPEGLLRRTSVVVR